MAKITAYHRPHSVSGAVNLLKEPHTAVLAGGTQLIPNSEGIKAVVDLQSVGLDKIEVNTDGTITIGAMVRLQDLIDHASIPELVRQMAKQEGPNTFRHVGTVGGVVALADWESELYAALLLFGAVVMVQSTAGDQTFPLAGSWQLAAGDLITAVTIQTGGATASERVARTPADKPIVAVLGRQTERGITFAACGLAEHPILLAESDLDNLQPPADFRGSSAYRLAMAKVLVGRVRHRMESGA